MPKTEQQLNEFLMKDPSIGRDVFIAPGAVVIGDVVIGDCSSIWFNAVLRADINRIVIGHHSNVQDNCVVHLADEFPCVLGNYVTVGHGAVVHACTVEDESLIGMNATVLDGVVVGHHSLVGANSLVPVGMQIPPGSLVMGVPAKVIRQFTPEEQALLKGYAEKYVRASEFYRRRFKPSS
jgi:carbonic anhydrase/acetyltransferase-like protein (isoleucine patch superfamily)